MTCPFTLQLQKHDPTKNQVSFDPRVTESEEQMCDAGHGSINKVNQIFQELNMIQNLERSPHPSGIDNLDLPDECAKEKWQFCGQKEPSQVTRFPRPREISTNVVDKLSEADTSNDLGEPRLFAEDSKNWLPNSASKQEV